MKNALVILLAIGLVALSVAAQSRHTATAKSDLDGSIISVFASRANGKADAVKLDEIFLYENGVEQKIKNFSFDPSPSRILVLVDNSQTVPADVEKLKAAAMEFAYEIFEGDQIFVLAFDEKPEIVAEWTDDAKKLETAFTTFKKEGNPYLFDAVKASLNEVLIPLMPGTRKTAIIYIGDGLDRGSKTKWDTVLPELQNYNVTFYALQLADRTGGAYRRNTPKANNVIKELTEGTGGLIFPFDEAQNAAKHICEELRRQRYNLSYLPVNTSTFDARRLFIVGNEGIKIRTKSHQPPNIK